MTDSEKFTAIRSFHFQKQLAMWLNEDSRALSLAECRVAWRNATRSTQAQLLPRAISNAEVRRRAAMQRYILNHS